MNKTLPILTLIFAILCAISLLGAHANLGEIRTLVVLNSTLPRILTALLCGALLSLSSLLLCAITHNPLASDSTSGVNASSAFGVLFLGLFAPALGTTLSAFVGALIGLGLLFALTNTREFSAFSATLCGLIIGLVFGALSALLLIFFKDESYFITVWLSGDLAQNGYANLRTMAILSLPALLVTLAFARSFWLFGLGDSTAKSLGLNVVLVRIIGFVLGAYFTAVAVAHCGIIAFVGLGASYLTNQLKFSSFVKKAIFCAILGALILAICDSGLIILQNLTQISLPAGAICAFLGAPMFLWLIHCATKDANAGNGAKNEIHEKAKYINLPLLGGILAVFVAFCLFYGEFSREIFALRINRVFTALLCGGILAVCGYILQSLTRNDMASPELLGISSGVSLGVLASMFFAPALGFVFGVFGALVVLGFILAINARSGMSPMRVILSAIAVSAFVSAVEKILLFSGDSRIYDFISYSAGSTYGASFSQVLLLAMLCVISFGVVMRFQREITILSLGDVCASSVGVDIFKFKTILFVFCAVLSAFSALCVGPVSFVGLIAPHLAKFLGFRKTGAGLMASALIGALIMSVADFLGRNLIFPYEIPCGVVATIIGSLYFLWIARKI
ncbi:iron ABC transporter permease [Campylobacter sp. VBCF_08 NA3]|uniref:iron ABC transporter permease n=1 Tax=Campylobacter sp. VBCF_08 NA3 TaxID=2983833 RepID=UPI0022E9A135|nr:iron ABC transporter permease [Campylobacter sp. VBCF_08 NA3]MDA3069474.1 iron ABC transporter permease [Campylobacter sp. VBCF_08 NA3]